MSRSQYIEQKPGKKIGSNSPTLQISIWRYIAKEPGLLRRKTDLQYHDGITGICNLAVFQDP